MRQPDPTLSITLDVPAVELGGRIQGRVARAGEVDDLFEEGDQNVRAVRLRLRYYTEGRGTKVSRVVDETEFPTDEYGRVDTAFDLHVSPAAPISYDGSLIRVLWELEATVDIERRIDRRTEIPILVLPTNGWGLYQRPHPLRS